MPEPTVPRPARPPNLLHGAPRHEPLDALHSRVDRLVDSRHGLGRPPSPGRLASHGLDALCSPHALVDSVQSTRFGTVVDVLGHGATEERRYPSAALPSCWLRHPAVIEALRWLRNAHADAYHSSTGCVVERLPPTATRSLPAPQVAGAEYNRGPVMAPFAETAALIAPTSTTSTTPADPTHQLDQAEKRDDQQSRTRTPTKISHKPRRAPRTRTTTKIPTRRTPRHHDPRVIDSGPGGPSSKRAARC